MNKFCKDMSKIGLSFDIIGNLTSLISKATIAAKDNGVDIDDVIDESNIILIANNIKKGSNPKSEMIRLINKSKIDNKKKVLIIAQF